MPERRHADIYDGRPPSRLSIQLEQIAGLTARYQRRSPLLQDLVETAGVLLGERGSSTSATRTAWRTTVERSADIPSSFPACLAECAPCAIRTPPRIESRAALAGQPAKVTDPAAG
ncbi:hypothetical protein GCM10019016_127150 [Streptomyces prasinosporus]|uniref:Uncharacterized protein n=1 Tax=Streptomyces prasinosporus TaxID=68256 RepID=A0ABP6UG40_9ACTN